MAPLNVHRIHDHALGVTRIIPILPRGENTNLELGRVVEYCKARDTANCAGAVGLILIIICAGIVVICIPWLCISGRCRRFCLSWENRVRARTGAVATPEVYRY